MTYIEVKVMGKVGFIALEAIVGVLSNVNTKPGSVVYCMEPIGMLEVDNSAEEMYELMYEATPSGEVDEEEEDEYVPDLADMEEAFELLALAQWIPVKENS